MSDVSSRQISPAFKTIELPAHIHEEFSILRNIRVDTGLHYDSRFNQWSNQITTPPEPTRKVKA
jgi:glutaredoxin 2